ncbi:MAG: hypothetical protein PWQ83_1087 [Thermosipho sp. (in: thermotogales)]|nr:hypothetical protein [Thermosipho sp. (in: thermotogales)]
MERIEGLKELLEANFGLLSEEEIKEIVEKLIKKYENKPKTRNMAKRFREELRKELERRDPKRVLFTIDK